VIRMADQKHPILLVDDERELLYSFHGLLRQDFEVHTAEGGRQALEVLAQHPIHVIMSDQRMPEMTGSELLAQACELYPETVRIIFTGYADIKAVVDAVNRAHIYRYLTKPWDPDDLIELLRDACQEYDELHAHRRLCRQAESCLIKLQEFLSGLDAGRYGSLSSDGHEQASQLQETTGSLLDRLSHETADGRRP